MRMRSRIMRTLTGVGALAVATLVFGSGSASAQVASPASPLQPSHYVPGIIGIRDVITPPPGLFLIWYNWLFTSNQFIDRDGNKVESILQGNVPVDISATAFATSPVLAFSSKRTVLFGARYIAGIAPSFFVADGVFALNRSRPILGDTVTRVREGTLSGFSDLIVAPVILSWAFGRFPEDASDPRDPFAGMSDEELFAETGMPPRRRWNATLAYWFAAPTGRYEHGADDNLGLGFWTHAFQAFGYWYPWYHQGVGVEAGVTVETHSRTRGTDVRTGNRLSLEYGVSAWPKPWLELGVGGANNWQVSDDTGDDVWWDPSVHDRKHMVNFTAGFMPVFMKFYIVAKYGFDYGARQRFDGHNFILNLYFVTGLLDGR